MLFPLPLLVAQGPGTFRSDITLVHVDAEVRQNQRAVGDLGMADFRVVDDGKQQTIVYFGHEVHAAFSDLRDGASVAVVGFGGTGRNCKTEVISEFSGEYGVAEQSIADRVLQGEFEPDTNGCSIRRGLDGAAQFLQKAADRNRRRAIVVISDDTGAPTRGAVVRRADRDLWDADAVVLGWSHTVSPLLCRSVLRIVVFAMRHRRPAGT